MFINIFIKFLIFSEKKIFKKFLKYLRASSTFLAKKIIKLII